MSSFGQVLDAQTLRFERLLPGPIERVWEHLANPALRRAWLAEAGEIRNSRLHRSLECSLADASMVRFELEPHGNDVLLTLTHRRVPACVIALCAALIAAVLTFMLSWQGAPASQPQYLGALNSVHLAGPAL